MDKTCRNCRFNYFGNCMKMKEVFTAKRTNTVPNIIEQAIDDGSVREGLAEVLDPHIKPLKAVEKEMLYNQVERTIRTIGKNTKPEDEDTTFKIEDLSFSCSNYQ